MRDQFNAMAWSNANAAHCRLRWSTNGTRINHADHRCLRTSDRYECTFECTWIACMHLLLVSQNSDKPIALSAASLLYAVVPSTRQHLAIDQLNSIKHFTHRLLQWNVILDNSARFRVGHLLLLLPLSSLLSIESRFSSTSWRSRSFPHIF